MPHSTRASPPVAIRSTTLRYQTLTDFMADHEATLRFGMVVLPAGTLEGQPAPEMRVDLLIPLVGRIGPIQGQLVRQMPDGSSAFRVPKMPPSVERAHLQVTEALAAVKQVWLAAGELTLPDAGLASEVHRLKGMVAALEASLQEAEHQRKAELPAASQEVRPDPETTDEPT